MPAKVGWTALQHRSLLTCAAVAPGRANCPASLEQEVGRLPPPFAPSVADLQCSAGCLEPVLMLAEVVEHMALGGTDGGAGHNAGADEPASCGRLLLLRGQHQLQVSSCQACLLATYRAAVSWARLYAEAVGVPHQPLPVKRLDALWLVVQHGPLAAGHCCLECPCVPLAMLRSNAPYPVPQVTAVWNAHVCL